MDKTQTIKEILETLSSLEKGIQYKIRCIYSDGRENTILCIYFYERKKIIGKISFRRENGSVCKYYYKNLSFRNTQNIVDLLLDIYNHEVKLVIN